MPRRLVILITLSMLSALSALGPACLAGTITLRASAAVNTGAPITLGDIATLEGDDALSLGGVVIREADAKHSRPVTLGEVRAALEKGGVNWGRLALRGGQACELRVNAPSHSTTGATPRATAVEPGDSAQAPTGERVQGRVIETLAGLFGVAHDDLRISFDDASRELLATPVQGRRVDVQTSAAASSRLMIRVWVYEGDHVVAHGTIRADVRLRVNAVVLRAAVSRGVRLTPEHLGQETLWMEPSGAPPVREMRDALGAVAKTRLDAGSVLRTDHVEPPLVIRRGDLVSVHALAGGLTVRTRARAMADAREGELVELSRARDRKPFVARAAGPGIAVLDAGESDQR